MGRQAKIRKFRRADNPGRKSVERAMRTVQRRKDAVDHAIRLPRFAESFKSRVNLLAGTPGEITNHEMIRQLAIDILDGMGVSTEGINISSAWRMGRLQFFVRISPTAQMEAINAAAAAPKPPTVQERTATP